MTICRRRSVNRWANYYSTACGREFTISCQKLCKITCSCLCNAIMWCHCEQRCPPIAIGWICDSENILSNTIIANFELNKIKYMCISAISKMQRNHLIFALLVCIRRLCGAASAAYGLWNSSGVPCSVVYRSHHEVPQRALSPPRDSTFGRGSASLAPPLCSFQHASADERNEKVAHRCNNYL